MIAVRLYRVQWLKVWKLSIQLELMISKIFSSIHSPYNSYLYIKDLVINQYRPIANKIEDSTDLISMKWF